MPAHQASCSLLGEQVANCAALLIQPAWWAGCNLFTKQATACLMSRWHRPTHQAGYSLLDEHVAATCSRSRLACLVSRLLPAHQAGCNLLGERVVICWVSGWLPAHRASRSLLGERVDTSSPSTMAFWVSRLQPACKAVCTYRQVGCNPLKQVECSCRLLTPAHPSGKLLLSD
jgi:hypothetical protein